MSAYSLAHEPNSLIPDLSPNSEQKLSIHTRSLPDLLQFDRNFGLDLARLRITFHREPILSLDRFQRGERRKQLAKQLKRLVSLVYERGSRQCGDQRSATSDYRDSPEPILTSGLAETACTTSARSTGRPAFLLATENGDRIYM